VEDTKKYEESRETVLSVAAWAVLLFVLTVLGGLPLLLGGLNFTQISGSTPHLPLIMVGMLVSACAPTLAALLVARFYPGAGGARSVLRQVRTWRVGIIWYALALIGPIVLFLVTDAVHVALGGVVPVQWLAFHLRSGFGPGSLFWVVFGSLFAEELGWRGFGQPRLQGRYGALGASILIGVLWATWHLWPVITPGCFALETPEDVAATYIRMIAASIVYSWMYNSTNGSLFLVMVAHFGHNFAGSVVPTSPDSSHFHFTIALLYLAAAIGILLMADWRTLTRTKNRRSELLADQ
jgi:membrane protease YdiL (CAAX protease family)